MPPSSVDIIVPVWNNDFEARTCLSAILTHSPDARLIIVDNGSNRQTQLVLEEFSEPLGENCLFLFSEKNVGHVRAINRGLSRSDSDMAVIVRPHVTVTAGWLEGLREAAERGLASPVFSGSGAPFPSPLVRGCSLTETSRISFSTLALKREAHQQLGGFDEEMDGGEWCLQDYVRRAASKGFQSCITSRSTVVCGQETILGSEERRREQACASRSMYAARWGAGCHYGVYFGRGADADGLTDAVELILRGARLGHRFTLLLHPSQAAVFRRMGWNGLHTSIQLHVLSRFAPRRALQRFCRSHPDMVAVLGAQGAEFSDGISAIPFGSVLCEPGPS